MKFKDSSNDEVEANDAAVTEAVELIAVVELTTTLPAEYPVMVVSSGFVPVDAATDAL